jgi:hypothetical protein
MEGAMHLLAHGGMLPHFPQVAGEKEISPRKKGVKQGALLMLIGAVLVPLMGVFAAFAPGRIELMFEFFAALSAILCFVGGPLRMLYAAIFEEGAATRPFIAQSSYAPPSIPPPPAARVSALPPAAANPARQWRPRPQTAEILQPPSVTDSTTRLLEKPEPKGD